MSSRNHLFLAVWAVFIIGTTTFWIFKNNLPPSWDEANYLEASEELRQSLVDHGFFNFINATTKILPAKAPLIAILPVPLYIIIGSSPHVALILNLIFIVIFYIFFYKLVAEIFDTKLAVASAIPISTMPLFYGLARYFYVEFGLMTLVVIWMYLVLKTKNLTDKNTLFLLGIISGLGIMMKLHFLIFVAGPALVIFYESWRKIKRKLFDYKKVLIFIIPALAISLPWYARNILTVLWKAKRSTDPELLGDLYYGSPLSIINLYGSALDFINYVVSSYWTMVLLILFVVFVHTRKKIKIICSNIKAKIGIFSALAFLIASTLIYLNTGLFGAKFITNKISFGPLIFTNKMMGGYVQAPRNESWPIVNLLKFLTTYTSLPQKTVILASEDEAFNINGLKYYATLNKLPLDIKSASYFQKETSYQVIQTTINQGDYLVMKIGGKPGPADLNRFNSLILQNLDQKIWQELTNNIDLPDGSKIKIWQKIS
ncbi:MAG: 4-amino-4-deoxy-L-arabinose transferase and related glycosyltransferases of PMT family-like protein [Microgenomates group bacterium GW2011_GWA2_44_7]|nr:MAG: 4-amino-4-deoxy-L-arabinose transferase and related glycosyltransferases of PMT family-like protein [Microgenomates group bacterium GW2011_GWA2_44_7]